MIVRQGFFITAVCILILFVDLLYPLSPARDRKETEEKIVTDYVGQIETLVGLKDKNDDQFYELTGQLFQRLESSTKSELEYCWNGDELLNWHEGRAAVSGQYIAEIMVINWRHPWKIFMIGNYIKNLGEQFSANKSFTASWKLFNNIAEGLKKADSFRGAFDLNGNDLQLIQINRGDKDAEKKKLALKKLTLLGNKLMNKHSVYLMGRLQEIESRVNNLPQIPPEVFVQKRGLGGFVRNNLILIIMGMLLLVLGAIFLFLFFFMGLKKQMRIKLILPWWGEDTDSPKKVLPDGKGCRRPFESLVGFSTFQANKPNNVVNIQKAFTIIRDVIVRSQKSNEENTSKLRDTIEETKQDRRKLEAQYTTFKQKVERDMKEIHHQFNIQKKDLEILGFEKLIDDISKKLIALKTNERKNNKIEEVDERIDKLERSLSSLIMEKAVLSEREMLKEIWNWKPEGTQRKELLALVGAIDEKESFFRHCDKLESQITFEKELASFYGDIIKPVRNYHYKITEIRGTLEVMGKKNISANPTKDLFEIKLKTYFLIFLQYLNQVPQLLEFKPEKWFQDDFLDFTDQFLRKKQKAVYAGTQTKEMKDTEATILEILSFFSVEPIPITLGKTAFDSRLHYGQATISDPAMIDGAIAEIVKNGFRKIKGEVIRQPRVIVNRV